MYKRTVSHHIAISQDEGLKKKIRYKKYVRYLSFFNVFQANSTGLFHISFFSSAPNFSVVS